MEGRFNTNQPHGQPSPRQPSPRTLEGAQALVLLSQGQPATTPSPATTPPNVPTQPAPNAPTPAPPPPQRFFLPTERALPPQGQFQLVQPLPHNPIRLPNMPLSSTNNAPTPPTTPPPAP